MSNPTDKRIRKAVHSYLSGEITLRRFEAWFIPATWDLPMSDLVGEITLRLAEYSNGDWTEAELKGLLREATP